MKHLMDLVEGRPSPSCGGSMVGDHQLIPVQEFIGLKERCPVCEGMYYDSLCDDWDHFDTHNALVLGLAWDMQDDPDDFEDERRPWNPK